MSSKKQNKIQPNARSRVADITSPVRAEVKKSKKRSMTIKDYGKQKGYMWAFIFFTYALILLISKYIFDLQYDNEPFPSQFNSLFLLFLPVAIGFAAFIIARIAAVAVRGLLLMLIITMPWLYTLNIGMPPIHDIFGYTILGLKGEQLIPFFLALIFALSGNFIYNSMRVYFPERRGVRFWSFLPLVMFFLFANAILLLDTHVYDKNFYFHVTDMWKILELKIIILIPAGIAVLYLFDGLFVSKRNFFTRMLYWLTNLYILALVGYWGYQSMEIVPTLMPEQVEKFGNITGRIWFDTVMLFIYVFSLVGIFASGLGDILINLLLVFTKKKKKVKEH